MSLGISATILRFCRSRLSAFAKHSGKPLLEPAMESSNFGASSFVKRKWRVVEFPIANHCRLFDRDSRGKFIQPSDKFKQQLIEVASSIEILGCDRAIHCHHQFRYSAGDPGDNTVGSSGTAFEIQRFVARKPDEWSL